MTDFATARKGTEARPPSAIRSIICRAARLSATNDNGCILRNRFLCATGKVSPNARGAFARALRRLLAFLVRCTLKKQIDSCSGNLMIFFYIVQRCCIGASIAANCVGGSPSRSTSLQSLQFAVVPPSIASICCGSSFNRRQRNRLHLPDMMYPPGKLHSPLIGTSKKGRMSDGNTARM